MLTNDRVKELVESGVIKKAHKVMKKTKGAEPSTPAELKKISASLVSIIEKSNRPDETMTRIIDSLLEVIKSLKQVSDNTMMARPPKRPSAWEFKLERDERQQLSGVKATAIK